MWDLYQWFPYLAAIPMVPIFKNKEQRLIVRDIIDIYDLFPTFVIIREKKSFAIHLPEL